MCRVVRPTRYADDGASPLARVNLQSFAGSVALWVERAAVVIIALAAVEARTVGLGTPDEPGRPGLHVVEDDDGLAAHQYPNALEDLELP
jgi:hypothetical protein